MTKLQTRSNGKNARFKNFIYDYTGKYDDVYLVVAGDDKNVCNDMVDHGNKTEDEYMLRYTFGDCADKLAHNDHVDGTVQHLHGIGRHKRQRKKQQLP